MTAVPHPLYFFFVPLIEDKTESHHNETTDAIEAEQRAVLNALTKHHFQDAVKNGRIAGKGTYERKGTNSRVIVTRYPEFSF
jgi:hypothetical protein